MQAVLALHATMLTETGVYWYLFLTLQHSMGLRSHVSYHKTVQRISASMHLFQLTLHSAKRELPVFFYFLVVNTGWRFFFFLLKLIAQFSLKNWPFLSRLNCNSRTLSFPGKGGACDRNQAS